MKMPAAVKKQPAQEVAIKEHNVVALNPEENAIPDYMKADIGQRYGMEIFFTQPTKWQSRNLFWLYLF